MINDKSEWKLFLIQKHKTKTVHYDFRLEKGGVLKSWAIPKGPSYIPSEKRLAIEVEDHSLNGATEENDNKIIWDKGKYKNITGLQQNRKLIPYYEAYENGVIEIELKGEKLKGNWVLVAIAEEKNKNHWLLIKKKDEYAKSNYNIVEDKPGSVISED
ncbi:MAG: DNA polymerase ligase N-terminal domain-containing protein [Bacillota bacterium]